MTHFFVGRGWEDTNEEKPHYYVTDLQLPDEKDEAGALYGMQYDGTDRNAVVPVYVEEAKDPQYILETNPEILAELKEALQSREQISLDDQDARYFANGWLITQSFTPARWYQYKMVEAKDSFFETASA